MKQGIRVPEPRTYDLNGGSCLTATVAGIPDLQLAIVVDHRDAALIADALAILEPDNDDDREAAQKLSALIAEEIGRPMSA